MPSFALVTSKSFPVSLIVSGLGDDTIAVTGAAGCDGDFERDFCLDFDRDLDPAGDREREWLS